jgi:hypothetical protein
LDGATINRELAETFQPDDERSALSRSNSVPLKMRSRYYDDFCTNVEKGVDYRLPIQKPKQQKHIRHEDKLLFTDSVTHEAFPTHTGIHSRKAHMPLSDKPSNGSAGFRFCGSTRYAEEFIDLSKNGYRVDLVKGRDDSNRVHGSSIPNRLREFIFENEVKDVRSLPNSLDSIMSETQGYQDKRTRTGVPENPYLKDYLHVF